jgi:hypothetical protein
MVESEAREPLGRRLEMGMGREERRMAWWWGGSRDEGTGGADSFPTVPIRLHLRVSGIGKSARGEKPKFRFDIDVYEYLESTS